MPQQQLLNHAGRCTQKQMPVNVSAPNSGSDPSTFRIGIVGHRYLANKDTIAFVSSACSAFLKQFQAEHKNVVALSALAEGADTLFAEAAVALHIPLQIVRPFQEYATDFSILSAKNSYERLRLSASNETSLEYIGRSNDAYLAGMHWIVDRCNLLVAVWDGSPAKGLGGTGDAVERAVLMNRDWIHLDVVDLSVTYHLATTMGG